MTSPSAVTVGASGVAQILLGTMDTGFPRFHAELLLNTFAAGTYEAMMSGQVFCSTTSNLWELVSVAGSYDGSTPANFEILSAGSATITGTVYLYELALA